MTISVIITSYNVERYIARAVNSALAQPETSEIIIVDDCSTDNTLQILRSISDPRLKIFTTEKNSGPAHARNLAISHATGNWLAILDGDDYFAENRLARCIQHKADIIIDNLSVTRESDGATFPMFDFSATKPLTLADYISSNAQSGYNFGYTKPIIAAEFLKKHALSYNTALRIGEDYLLMAEALAHGAHCIIEPTAGYHYTARNSSISHRLTPADLEPMIAADQQFKEKYSLDENAKTARLL